LAVSVPGPPLVHSTAPAAAEHLLVSFLGREKLGGHRRDGEPGADGVERDPGARPVMFALPGKRCPRLRRRNSIPPKRKKLIRPELLRRKLALR
jgi:hypothetical protein